MPGHLENSWSFLGTSKTASGQFLSLLGTPLVGIRDVPWSSIFKKNRKFMTCYLKVEVEEKEDEEEKVREGNCRATFESFPRGTRNGPPTEAIETDIAVADNREHAKVYLKLTQQRIKAARSAARRF